MFTLRPNARLASLAFAPDGAALAGVGEGVAYVWDLAERSLLFNEPVGNVPDSVILFDGPASVAVLTATGELVSRDLSAKGWRALAPVRQLRLLVPLPGFRAAFVTAPPTRLGVFAFAGFAQEWIIELPGATALACSSDGSHLAFADQGGTVHLLDARSGKERHRWFCGSASPTGLAIAPGGKAVACIAGQFLHFHRMPPGSDSNHHRLNEQHFTGIAWHPSGDLFATTKGDGNADFWDGRDGERRQSFGWGAGALTAIAFDPSGDLCAAASEDGRVIVWDVDR